MLESYRREQFGRSCIEQGRIVSGLVDYFHWNGGGGGLAAKALLNSGQLVRKESVHLRELIFQHLRSPSVKLPEKYKLFLGNSTRSASHNSEAGQ